MPQSAAGPTHANAAREFWLDTDDCVARDMPCVHCRYNLRTLAASAACPECGRPVHDSIPLIVPLSYQPLPWLTTVRLGFFLFAGSFLLWPVAGWIVMASSGTFPRIVGQRVQPSLWSNLSVIIPPVLIAAVQMAGLWLLTTRMPAPDNSGDLNGRRLLRVCIPFALGLTWVSCVFSTTMDPLGYLVMRAASLASSVISTVLFLCWFTLVAELARRVPSPRLKLLSNLVMALCALSLIAGIGYHLLQLAMVVAAPSPAPPYAMEEGAVPGQYLVFEEDGSMVRTTTVPASLLIPPAERPVWLEDLYLSVATLGGLWAFTALTALSGAGQLLIGILMGCVLYSAVQKRRAMVE